MCEQISIIQTSKPSLSFTSITEMESKQKLIAKWLTDSGLIVNKNKTEVCLSTERILHPLRLVLII